MLAGQKEIKMVLFTLTLVRHGETVANRRSIIQGQQDTPLSETGEQQARLVGGRLKDESFTHVFTSDLSRAAKKVWKDWCFTPYSRIFHLYNGRQDYGGRKPSRARGKLATISRLLEDLPTYSRRGRKHFTAQVIVESNRVSRCELVYDPRLRERKFGNVEGKTYKDLVAAARKSNTAPADFNPKGSENIKQLRDRAVSFFKDLCEKLKSYSATEEADYVPGSIKRRIESEAESCAARESASHPARLLHPTSTYAPMNKVVSPSGLMEDDIEESQVKRPRHTSADMDSDAGETMFPMEMSRAGAQAGEGQADTSSHSDTSQSVIARSNSSSSSGYASLPENPELQDCDLEQLSPGSEREQAAAAAAAASRESTPCDIDSLFHPIVASDAEIKSQVSPKSRDVARHDCPNVSLSPLLEHRLSSISSISSGRNSSFDDGDGLALSAADVLVVSHGGFMKELIRHFIEDLGCKVPGGKGHALRVSPNTGLSKFTVTAEEDNGRPVITCLVIHDKDHLLNMMVPQEDLAI